jgi:membrane associated rhomboid family serine protease
MAIYRNRRWLVEPPHAATYVLLTVNVFVFALCLRGSGSTDISSEVLFLNGAMYAQALARHEYWRLIAAGFLHADPLHLLANMLCLVLWGGPLEKRIGSLYFLVIYFGAMIAGAIVSNIYHSQPYLGVGASGAISGILGALLCLWALGKIDLSASFFVMNIGLNVAAALAAPRIDWTAHVGGLAAGLILCAAIDQLERANKHMLRCKFPEFVKVNGCILAALLSIWINIALGDTQLWLLSLVCSVSFLVAIKLIDLVLSIRKGLAIVVVLLCFGNAALSVVLADTAAALPGRGCASTLPGAGGLVGSLLGTACANWPVALGVIALGACGISFLLYAQEFQRGIEDVGFVGATMVAERRRCQGL